MKWCNAVKGYGVVPPDDGGKDVFVHISAVEQAGLRNLQEGQRISYEVIADKRTGKSAAGNLHAAGRQDRFCARALESRLGPFFLAGESASRKIDRFRDTCMLHLDESEQNARERPVLGGFGSYGTVG